MAMKAARFKNDHNDHTYLVRCTSISDSVLRWNNHLPWGWARMKKWCYKFLHWYADLLHRYYPKIYDKFSEIERKMKK